jgi:hypothetical protein
VSVSDLTDARLYTLPGQSHEVASKALAPVPDVFFSA